MPTASAEKILIVAKMAGQYIYTPFSEFVAFDGKLCVGGRIDATDGPRAGRRSAGGLHDVGWAHAMPLRLLSGANLGRTAGRPSGPMTIYLQI